MVNNLDKAHHDDSLKLQNQGYVSEMQIHPGVTNESGYRKFNERQDELRKLGTPFQVITNSRTGLQSLMVKSDTGKES